MHAVDCKGAASAVYGSIVAILIRDPRLGPNQPSRLATINTNAQELYSSRPGAIRLPKIRRPN
eukprot:8946495-Pyramimonas_sp.AAC.1